jgi:hypothetical protein
MDRIRMPDEHDCGCIAKGTVPDDAPSEPSQQEAYAKQCRKGDHKSYSGLRERWRSNRRKIRCCDFCLRHNEYLQ